MSDASTKEPSGSRWLWHTGLGLGASLALAAAQSAVDPPAVASTATATLAAAPPPPAGAPPVASDIPEAAPALSVTGQRTGCRQRALFARWLLRNDGSSERSATVRASLSSAGSGEQRQGAAQTVVLAPGEAREVSFAFAREGATEDARVTLSAQRRDGTFTEVYSAPARFPCLRDCPATHVLVRTPPSPRDDDASACPRRGGWSGSVAARDSERGYCSYAWELDGAAARTAPDLDQFDDVDAEDWEKDCLAIGAQASLLPGQLVQATDARLGIDDLNALSAPDRAAWRSSEHPVRLAVIDTAAHGYDDTEHDDTSDHGRLVGLVARRTACADDDDCPVEIDNRPALRVVYDDSGAERSYAVDADSGGYIGSRGQIARAINRTLRDWDPEQERLVINLSLGWHGKWDCRERGCGQPLHVDMPSELRVPSGTAAGYSVGDGEEEGHGLGTRAVLMAIARARCMGALVFAAVGNAVSKNDRGALLPAAWNALDAGRLDCARMFDGVAAGGRPSGGLVAAVAAVNFDGRRTALSRRGALPFLVAHGVGISAHDTRPRALANDGVTGPLSGSSLATAVVSGAAARFWALAGPQRSAEEVLQALYSAGTPMVGDDGGAPPESDLCGRGGGPCRVPVELDACTPLRALDLLASATEDSESEAAHGGALRAAAAACTAERSLPRSSAPSTAPSETLMYGPSRGGFSPAADAGGESGASDADGTLGRVDMYEAPFCQPQPGPVRCAVCTAAWDAVSARYELDLDAYAEDGAPIAAAYVSLRQGGYSPLALPASLLRDGSVQGLLELNTSAVSSSPSSLLVEFESTPTGIPVSSVELIPLQHQ